MEMYLHLRKQYLSFCTNCSLPCIVGSSGATEGHRCYSGSIHSCKSGYKEPSGILWRSTSLISIPCGCVRGRAGAARRSTASSIGLTRATVCVCYLISSTHVLLTVIFSEHKRLSSFLKLASRQPRAAYYLLPPSLDHPTFESPPPKFLSVSTRF